MELLIINSIILLAFIAYIFKVSYFYDYRYIGNVIRFILLFFIIDFIITASLSTFFESNFSDINDVIIHGLILFTVCLLVCILYKKFLIKKFGKEERFANSEEVDNIGNLEE